MCRIVRDAVDRIWNKNARDAICAVYWEGKPVKEYAYSIGISGSGVYERLQQGYAILRKDPSIISLALAEGFDTKYYRYKGLDAYRRSGTSTVEDAFFYQEEMEQKFSTLYRQLGNLSGLSRFE